MRYPADTMAFRIASRHVCASLRAPRVYGVSTRFASSAAAAVQGSSLPQDVKDSIAVGAPEISFASQMLISHSVIRLWQPRILKQVRKLPASSTSSYLTWSRPMCAHHRCSRRERGVICGISRTGNTWTSQLVSQSMLWAIVMLV